MKDPLQPQHCARVLGALAASERLKIVRFLKQGPRNVTEIAEMLRTPLVNASHHLAVLRNAGLVAGRKKGRFVLYSLRPGVFEEENEAAGAEHLNLGCCRLEIPKSEKGET